MGKYPLFRQRNSCHERAPPIAFSEVLLYPGPRAALPFTALSSPQPQQGLDTFSHLSHAKRCPHSFPAPPVFFPSLRRVQPGLWAAIHPLLQGCLPDGLFLGSLVSSIRRYSLYPDITGLDPPLTPEPFPDIPSRGIRSPQDRVLVPPQYSYLGILRTAMTTSYNGDRIKALATASFFAPLDFYEFWSSPGHFPGTFFP